MAILAAIIATVVAGIILQLIGPVKVLPAWSITYFFQWMLISALLFGIAMAVIRTRAYQQAQQRRWETAARQEFEREARFLIENIEITVHSRFRRSPSMVSEWDYSEHREWATRVRLVEKGLQKLGFPMPKEFLSQEEFMAYTEKLLLPLRQGNIEGARRFAREWLGLGGIEVKTDGS